ncbi:MAG: ferritin-like domain-containing protein, partial [Pseudomonadota bacterium]
VSTWKEDPPAILSVHGEWPAPAAREKPLLMHPNEMPRRGLGTLEGRIALLHAIAHIELNAIDLAIDMAGRFAFSIEEKDRQDFITDWLKVADDEARHFQMVSQRLQDLGAAYGDLPAHDGLWQAAVRTDHDVLARLAIAPMVLEARGLDVTPGMISKLQQVSDPKSVRLLTQIYEEEIAHVATGTKWFRRICDQRELLADEYFQKMVEDYFPGGLKRPFNTKARDQSNFPEDWYIGLVDL